MQVYLESGATSLDDLREIHFKLKGSNQAGIPILFLIKSVFWWKKKAVADEAVMFAKKTVWA